MKREYPDSSIGASGEGLSKGKHPAPCPDEDNDELLAALGYKVRSSDMADVAQKLEQLEMAMGMGAAAAAAAQIGDDMGFFPDTVHYNPSDLSTWLDSMLNELNTPPAPLPAAPSMPPPPPSIIPSFDPAESSTVTFVDPNPVSQADPTRERKRMRTGSGSGSCSSSSSSSLGRGAAVATIPSEQVNPAPVAAPGLQVVVVDPQEAGVRLVHALMACAEAVQQDNLKAADALIKQISLLAASQGGAMRKVASYFSEALARRIYRLRPSVGPVSDLSTFDPFFADTLHMHFYETCPYLKFAHFTANQAVLEAFAGCKRVHVVDFGIKGGMQWPALIQALALRPGGPPSFQLTGVGPPQPNNTDALQEVGLKLAQFAQHLRVDFKYRGLVANSLADIEPYMLEDESGNGEPEAVAINSVLELHGLLARPGELDKVLDTVRKVKPKIFTVVEQEANHNSGSFLERFTEALHYYSTMFDSLEGSNGSSPTEPQDPGQPDPVMSDLYLGRQICNIVANEGPDRTERHENLAQWQGRFNLAGFEPVRLGSNAFKQASTLLALYAGGDGYRVEEKDGCLTLGWHTRPLIATSAWRVTAA